MKNNKGITLIELLISIIIASIIIFAAGGISKISLNAFYKELNKQQIHNDLSYGLKLIRHRFRNAQASSVLVNAPASSSWLNNARLEIDKAAFGIYLPNNSSAREFVFLRNKSMESKCGPPYESNDECEPLLIVPNGNITWSVTCNPSCSDLKTITVVVKRESQNNSIPFHMETTVARRNK